MLKSNIQTFLENEPLVINWQNIDVLKNIKHGSVFFGIGLVSRDELSVAVPFDILSFFFVSELLRNTLNLSKVVVLIADSHAISNNIFDDKLINKQADQTQTQLEKVKRNFAFKNFEIISTSQIHKLPSFQKIVSRITNMENEYLRLEIADTLWLKKNKNLQIKLGWAISKENRVGGNDERFFDKEIVRHCPNISLIHLQAGRTFDPARPKVSPYLSIENEKRILLKSDENIKEKLTLAKNNWPDKSMGGTISHLHDIVRCFEKIQGKLPFNTLEDKLQFIVDKATV